MPTIRPVPDEETTTMNSILRSLFTSLRPLLRKPGFTIAVIVILALGIGVNVATLGLLYRYYISPMPYPEGNRLVKVYFAINNPVVTGRQEMSVPIWLALKKDTPALAVSGIYDEKGYNLTRASSELRLQGTEASASLFMTLDVQPLLGRVFGPQSMQPGAQPIMVLSYRLWQTLFGGKASAIGQTLQLNGKLFTVIGVMPPQFNFPTERAQLWTPRIITADDRNSGTALDVTMIGRLAPSVPLASVNTQANAVLGRLIASGPAAAAALLRKYDPHINVQDWRSTQIGNLRQSLILVLCATLLLMLLVWFNLANMFLARTLARRGEFAMRQALGAGKIKLALAMLRENLFLSLIGALGGILLARFLLNLFSASSIAVPTSAISGAPWAVLIAIALALAILSAAIFTVTGLSVVGRNSLADTLRGADAHASAGPTTRRVRASLITGQIALACAIVGTGLLLGRGLLNLNSVGLGFNPNQVTTFKLSFPEAQYPLKHMTAALDELHTAIARLPGVGAVAIAEDTPLDGRDGRSKPVFPHPWDANAQAPAPVVLASAVDASYLRTLGIPLIAGRNFLPTDTKGTASVAVIDTLAARQLFGTKNVIGREFSFLAPTYTQPGVMFRIVGVVPAIRNSNLASAPTAGSVYTDLDQAVNQLPQLWGQRDWYLIVRSPLSTASVISDVHGVAHRIIPDVPLYDIQTMDQRVAGSLASNRLLTVMVLLFAVGSLLLAAVGLYALQAYAVAQRSREFAIRAALGATQNRLIVQVLGETARLLAIGLVVGLSGLAVIGVAFASAFYGIGAVDPLSMLIVVVVLTLAAFAASWLPAWHASRVEPHRALRSM